MSQPSQHDADHGDVDPGFFTARKHFVVLGQSAPGGEPSERSLYYPPTRKDMEPPGPDLLPIHFSPFRGPDASHATPGVFDNLDLPAQRRLDPLDKTTFVVGAIGPDQLETRKALSEGPEQVFATIMVLKTGLMHEQMHDQPIGVDEQVPLAAFDLLAAVVAARPPFWLVFTA